MADDKFILMGLNDDNSKNMAEILGSKTAKKILDFLGDVKGASEKDISDGLKTPINTIEYNLKKLIKSGLVKKSNVFFWSVKGKKIPMYKLARKHVIISPGKKPNLNYIKSIIPVILVAAFLMVMLSGVFNSPSEVEEDELGRFRSYDDLKNFLSENSEGGWNGDVRMMGGVSGDGEIFASTTGAIEFAESDSVSAVPKSGAVSSGVASEYSETNIQVEGVDEPDIVKNDGKYIYVVSGNKLFIIDAYPAEDMKILSEIEFNGWVSEMFVNGNKLVVFGGGVGLTEESKVVSEMGFAPGAPDCLGCGGYSAGTGIFVYDISDRGNPELDSKISVDGSYVGSRMIGDYVYVISTKYADFRNPELPVYSLNGVEEKVLVRDVYYFDYPDTSYVFTSIGVVGLDDGEFDSKVYLTGASRNVFVSEDNIYLTYQKTINYNDYLNDFVENVALVVLPESYSGDVVDILESDGTDYQKLSEISELILEYSNSLKGDSKAEFDDRFRDLGEKFEEEMRKKIERSVVHKIGVDKMDIEYLGNGDVPGMILNQFSMDEYNGYFRVAVTTGNMWDSSSLNHIYILNEDLEIIGSVEDLAKGERIYSTRFMGDRAYLVTFRNIDPLFVVVDS